MIKKWWNDNIVDEPGALPIIAFLLFVAWMFWADPGYPTGLVRYNADGPVYCGYKPPSGAYTCDDDE